MYCCEFRQELKSTALRWLSWHLWIKERDILRHEQWAFFSLCGLKNEIINVQSACFASLHCRPRTAVAGVLCWGIFQWPVMPKFSQSNIKKIIYIRLPRYLDHNKNLLNALLCNMILPYGENFTPANFCQAKFYLAHLEATGLGSNFVSSPSESPSGFKSATRSTKYEVEVNQWEI